MWHNFSVIGWFLLSLLLISCGSHQAFNAPTIKVNENWDAYIRHADFYLNKQSNEVTSAEEWWQQIAPPQLQILRKNMLNNNYDLKIANIKIKASNLLLEQIKSDQRPGIGVNSSWSGSYNKINRSRSYIKAESTSIGINYEIDYLLKNIDKKNNAHRRIEVEKIQKQLLITEQESLLAMTYWQLMVNKFKQNYSYQQLALLNKKLMILTAKENEGFLIAIDITSAQQAVDEQQIAIMELDNQQQILRNNISLLLGEPPGSYIDTIADFSSIKTIPQIRAHMPAWLLAHRPDIKLQLLQLTNDWQDNQSSYKQFFPTISLTGAGGEPSLSLLELLVNPIQLAISLSANLSLNYFEIQNSRHTSKFKYELSVLEYKKKLLESLTETAQVLSENLLESEKLTLISDNVNESKQRMKLAKLRWQEGFDEYLTYIETELSYINNKNLYIEQRFTQLNSALNIYKVFGGSAQFTTIN